MRSWIEFYDWEYDKTQMLYPSGRINTCYINAYIPLQRQSNIRPYLGLRGSHLHT